MKKRNVMAMAVALMMTASMLAGCGQRGTSVDDVAQSGGSTNANVEAVNLDEDNLKVAAAVASMDTNTTRWIAGMENALSNYPNITFETYDAGGSAETQSQQIQEIINQDYDAIVLHAVDVAACASAVTTAEQQGIKVIHLNFGPDSSHSGGITNNSYSLGALVARDAYERTGGNAKCVAIGPPVALSSTVLGVNGFEDTLADMDGMEFLESQAGDWTTENANTIMRDLLSKYKNDIQVVFAHNDQMAIGAAQAIEAAGLTGQILVYGADGSADAIKYIKDGKMTASVAIDNELMGQTAMQMALYAMGAGVDGTQLSVTPVINEPQTLITAENVADYE